MDAARALFCVALWASSFGCWGLDVDVNEELSNIAHGEFDYAVPDFVKRAYVEKAGKPRDDDVFVASWPKSGTNWVKQIVHLIRIKCSRAQLKVEETVDLSDIVPFLEADPQVDHDSLITPRVYQTHLAYKDVPKGGKIIYVVRELADVAVSFWKYVQQFEGMLPNATYDDVAEMMMAGQLYYAHWPDHILGYWNARDENMLIVKYADLKKDLENEINRIADFMHIGLTSEEKNCVSEQSSFKSMKANAHRISGSEWSKRVTGLGVDPNFTLVNEGVSGNARKFSPNVIAALEKHGQPVSHLVTAISDFAELCIP